MTAHEVYEVNLAWTDLVIAGQQSRIDQLLDEIERLLPPGWQRNTIAEKQAEKRASERHWMLTPGRCYCQKLANREVRLWLLRASDHRIHGGLVEPTDPLRYDEDNAEAILDFRQRVLEPATKTCGLRISRNSLGPLSWVAADVLERLWAFYDSSQFRWPPTGDALRRWREFVISAYQNHAAFDRAELNRWFVEKGWQEAIAAGLIDQLLSDAALLSEYDDLRQPV
jgi:hypothetical protein